MAKCDLLHYLAGAGDVAPADVARALGLQYAAAAMALLRLLRQGLVHRYIDADHRGYWYCLSDRGYERLAYFEKED